MNRLCRSTILAVVAAFALTGCGNDDSGAGGGGDFNDADVTFAQSMIPHHEQAVEMAKMAQDHASTPQVRNLPTRSRPPKVPRSPP